MSNTLLSLLSADVVGAARDLHNTDPETAALLAALTRRYAGRAGDDLDRDEVANTAALYAPSLLTDGHGPTEAATVAVRRCVAAARRDAQATGDALTGARSLDAVTDDGQPLHRMVLPTVPDTAARYRTTGRDRHADALADLDDQDAALLDALAAQVIRRPACLDKRHEHDAACQRPVYGWKAGKVPAAAIRRALDPDAAPITGRAALAYAAQVTADADRVTADYRDALAMVDVLHRQGTEGWEPSRTYGLPRLHTPAPADYAAPDPADAPEDRARLALVPAEGPARCTFRLVAPTRLLTVEGPVRPGHTGPVRYVQRLEGPAQRVAVVGARPVAWVRLAPAARQTDVTRQSGRPVTVNRRALDRLGAWDGHKRVKATEQQARDHAARLAVIVPRDDSSRADLTPEQRRQERDLLAWLPDPEARTGRRLPGVTVDRHTGEAAAPAGQAGANGGSGGDRAALRPAAPRKGSRTGGTGPTIPAGPRR